MSKFNKLFEPFTFNKGITLKNRVVMSPMTTWSSNDDYTISDEEVAYYKKRVNGVGLVITGCTHVLPNGIGFTHEFAAYNDSFIPSLKKLADAAKSGGAPAILQLFHAGDKAIAELVPNGDVVSPSGVALTEAVSPRELTHEEILGIIHAFGETTRRAIEAGFDGVELHGAHGFLLQSFLSPFFNKRQDQWGGSLEKRLSFPIAVIREVKKAIERYSTKPFILGYRISPEEHQQDALRMNDTYALIDKLIEENVDYVHGSLVQALTSKPKYNQDNKKTYLELIVEHANNRIFVIAAGALESPEDVSESMERGLSLAVIGRVLISDPEWVEKVQQGRELEIQNVIKSSNVRDLVLPAKLWGVIQNAGPWFKVEQ
ncbi:NADH-dependent flavin oxidoreductase [Paenibacillus sp. FSL R7-0313]|uniref:NADH-dependent flavin oxidoreductase n=1 Tax=Paenibacillus sp. FSL R7-0313 TaxID=2954532 RepID=UPI0030D79074